MSFYNTNYRAFEEHPHREYGTIETVTGDSTVDLYDTLRTTPFQVPELINPIFGIGSYSLYDWKLKPFPVAYNVGHLSHTPSGVPRSFIPMTIGDMERNIDLDRAYAAPAYNMPSRPNSTGHNNFVLPNKYAQ
jgi:hypothetical protein